MKVTLEKLPASQVGFDIEIEGKKSQDIYDRMIKKLMQSANVPGFRKGKVPKQLLVRQIGEDKLKANVLEEVLQDGLNTVISENDDLQAIGSFELGADFETLLNQFVIGQPLQVKAAIDVHPQLEVQQYKGLTVQAEKIEPDLTGADKTLHQFQVKHSTLVPIEGRGAQSGDLVTITMNAVADGEPVPDVDAEDLQVTLDEEQFIPELVEEMAGMVVGETREITITMPEGYINEYFNGKLITFTIALNDIKARELPALDDEFAQSISNKQTMADLREYLEGRIIKDAEEATAINADRALVNGILKELPVVELPKSLTARESKYLVEQQIDWLTQTPEGEKLAKQIVTKEFVQELMTTNTPEAADRIKRSLALAEIARLENITVPRSQVLSLATDLKQQYDDKNLEQELLNQIAEDQLTLEKVVEWLHEHNTVEFVPAGSLKPSTETTIDAISEEADLDDLPEGEIIVEIMAETTVEAEVTEPDVD